MATRKRDQPESMQTTDCPLLIYQMGKVASSSLCEALNASGIAAAQTHFLGHGPLSAMLGQILNPATNDFFATHAAGQLTANIALTRRLLVAREHIERGGEAGPKAKIISLSRDPLDWYRAEFLQNFDGYIGAMRQFAGRRADDDSDDIACIVEAHKAMLHNMARLDLSAAMRPPYRVDRAITSWPVEHAQAALLRNGRNLLKPVLWFQHLFQEPTNIDIFALTPQRAGPGALRFENGFCEALIVKYEQLQEAMPAISAFVGVRHLELPRTNVSEHKSHSGLVSAALAQLEIPSSITRLLYSSAYCELFGYPRRDRF